MCSDAQVSHLLFPSDAYSFSCHAPGVASTPSLVRRHFAISKNRKKNTAEKMPCR